MPTIRYANHNLPLDDNQSVLETLLEAGYEIPNACRAGACQSCLMQAVSGKLPELAQLGLKETQKAQGYFLACLCFPDNDLEVRLPEATDAQLSATITEHQPLSADVVRIRLRPEQPLTYQPGQFVTLWRDEKTGRSYSLASVPEIDSDLEFHVKRIPGGHVSAWLYDEAKVGFTLEIQGPAGDCFYTPGEPDRKLLLAGTGTGLAPLYGIARDALQQGHAGEIHLFHGAVTQEGLYLHDTLKNLANKYANLHYHPCVLNGSEEEDSTIQAGAIDELILKQAGNLRDWKVYLCGPEERVQSMRKKCFLAGANMKDIYADAFVGQT